ncbi:DUF1194 domain-containing protein [Azospirillum thermophilum]|nr:DUF1194 domain-containing protein [Azospirillum thermophilum]
MIRHAVLFVVLLLAVMAGPADGRAESKTGGRAGPSRAAVELVLALDRSASITDSDLDFQLRGHAAAFRDPDVAAAIGNSEVAVTLVSYSGPRSLQVHVPWRLLRSEADARAFADAIDGLPRNHQGDSTAIGAAIEDAAALFGGSGYAAPRKVIDIVSNGFSNSGVDPVTARDRAVARGITINGLAILDEFPWLEDYFKDNVIGGDNCFAKSATDQESFIEALRQKLILEIAARPAIPTTAVAAR